MNFAAFILSWASQKNFFKNKKGQPTSHPIHNLVTPTPAANDGKRQM